MSTYPSVTFPINWQTYIYIYIHIHKSRLIKVTIELSHTYIYTCTNCLVSLLCRPGMLYGLFKSLAWIFESFLRFPRRIILVFWLFLGVREEEMEMGDKSDADHPA